MKVGKLPESILMRSVLKEIKHRREEVLIGPALGQDCAALALKEGEVLTLSADPITGTVKDLGYHSIHVTANDLAASGAEPLGVMLTIMLPETVTESELQAIMKEAEAACASLDMEILGGHTEVTNVVRQPLVSVTGVGRIPKEELLYGNRITAGQDLVVSKWIGLEATAILAKEKAEQLAAVFAGDFIRRAQGFSQYLSVVPDARAAKKFGVTAMHDVTEGGILGALWEMAAGAKVGLEAELKKIPILQETVEICEFFNLNPYYIMSSGAMLIAAKDGAGLVRAMAAEGIPAAVIGQTTAGKKRILRNGDEIRYLDKPQTDELYKVMG